MKIRKNSRQWGVVALLLATLFSTLAQSATRVLIRFDESGHYVHRVQRTASTSAQSALSEQNQAVTPGEIALRWYGSNNELLASTRLIDPRVTHAPLQVGSTEFAWTVLYEGAYLVSGPDSAHHLEIILPQRQTPNLPAETWRLELL